MRSISLPGSLLGCALAAAACSSSATDSGVSSSGPPAAQASTNAAPGRTASGTSSSTGAEVASAIPGGGPEAPADAGAPDASGHAGGLDVSLLDPNKPAYLTAKELIGLAEVKSPGSLRKRWKSPEDLLDQTFGVGSVWLANQGNTAISHPTGSRKQCLEGLKGVVLQSAEQRRVCGADYMVPIYKDGKPDQAKACVDVFEFPNRPCELPVVWMSPSRAREVCQIEGKRLCTQDEWVLACRGNPEGEDLQDYAYGNDLDLTVCNTRGQRSAGCDPTSVKSTWKTCASDTAPAGSYPKCRSRFGVFDQHGNVAEIMQRWDATRERTVTQLKGSAFFYEKISMRPNDPPNKQKYPDHCAHDPRWHVENLETAGHTMYHLGFRCCKDVEATPQ